MADVITTVGKNGVAEMIGGLGSHTAWKYLALGSDGTTATAGDTALGSEHTGSGLARTAATVSTTTANILQLVHTWTATASKNVLECGVFDTTSSGGIILAHSDFATISLTSGDQIVVTYKVSVS